MPGGNRTGPQGMGAMSGRGAGFCSGSIRPGYANPNAGRGFGIGAAPGGWFRSGSGGRGWRNQYFATGMPGWMRSGSYTEPVTPTDKASLTQRLQDLQSELNAISKRLDNMD